MAEKSIDEEVKTLKKEGYDTRQAAAIAYSKAKKKKKKKKVNKKLASKKTGKVNKKADGQEPVEIVEPVAMA